MSDEDDLRLFESLDDPELAGDILRIERNDPEVDELRIRRSGRQADDRAWRRLGRILGRNATVRKLSLFLNEDAASIFPGIRNNRSLEIVELSGIDLRATGALDTLVPHLSLNPSLREISLVLCNLGSAGIKTLSRALSDRSGDTLEELVLYNNNIPDVDLDQLVLALSGKKAFNWLSLRHNGIGARGCTSLARLLEDDRSNLKHLHLGGNSIDDDSVVILADSLAKNTKLIELDLSYNEEITGAGMSAMLKLVCNRSGSSIDAVVNSNHTLRDVGVPLADLAHALGVDDANLLLASLEANRTMNKMLAAREKIIWSHARGDLNLGASSIAMGAMPLFMEWMGSGGPQIGWIGGSFEGSLVQYHDPPLPEARLGAVKLDALYRVVRSVPIGERGERDRAWRSPRKFGHSSSSVSSRSSFRAMGSGAISTGRYGAADNESIPDDLAPGPEEIRPDLRVAARNQPARNRSVPGDLEGRREEIGALRRENEELRGRMELLGGKMRLLERMMGGDRSTKRRKINDTGV